MSCPDCGDRRVLCEPCRQRDFAILFCILIGIQVGLLLLVAWAVFL